MLGEAEGSMWCLLAGFGSVIEVVVAPLMVMSCVIPSMLHLVPRCQICILQILCAEHYAVFLHLHAQMFQVVPLGDVVLQAQHSLCADNVWQMHRFHSET